MSLPLHYRRAGILIKIAAFISLTFYFFGNHPSVAGVPIMGALVFSFIFYGIGHIIQQSRQWARFPLLIFATVFFVAFLADLAFNYENFLWLATMIVIQILHIYATFLVFWSKPAPEIDLDDDTPLDHE